MGTDLSEFKSLYIKTAQEYIEKLKQNYAALAQNQQDMATINDAYISAHSLKGQSLAMGYKTTGTLARLLERICFESKNQKLVLTAEIVHGMQDALIKIADSVAQLAQSDQELDVSASIADLSQKAHMHVEEA